MPTAPVTIREATKDDIPALYELIMAIARHHDQEQYVLTSPTKLMEAAFPADESAGKFGGKFGALLAEVENTDGEKELAGYASYTWNYSIWLGGELMNIDDVFVWENYRGQKVGEKLMYTARNLCRSKGLTRLRWEVQQDNTKAIKFYERLGARVDIKGVCKWSTE